jgi:hypothetical protein
LGTRVFRIFGHDFAAVAEPESESADAEQRQQSWYEEYRIAVVQARQRWI